MKTDASVHLNREGIEKLVQGLKNRVERSGALADLLDEAFMAEHTTFPNIGSMFDESPLNGMPIEEWRTGLHSAEWSEFVNANTRFPDWNTMLRTALKSELKRRPGVDSPSTGASR